MSLVHFLIGLALFGFDGTGAWHLLGRCSNLSMNQPFLH
jgi:hypothetical protein